MINEKAVNFVEDAYYNGDISKIKLECVGSLSKTAPSQKNSERI